MDLSDNAHPHGPGTPAPSGSSTDQPDSSTPPPMPAPGWYPDPATGQPRWWTGSTWAAAGAAFPPVPGNAAGVAATAEPLTEAQERNAAMWAHLGPLLVALFGILTFGVLSIFSFLVPLLINQSLGNRSAYARKHAVESLNFTLTQMLIGLGAIVLSVVTFGLLTIVVIPVVIVLAIIFLIWRISAAIKASRGEDYRYPMTIRFVH